MPHKPSDGQHSKVVDAHDPSSTKSDDMTNADKHVVANHKKELVETKRKRLIDHYRYNQHSYAFLADDDCPLTTPRRDASIRSPPETHEFQHNLQQVAGLNNQPDQYGKVCCLPVDMSL